MELNFSFKSVKEEQPEKYQTLPVLTYVGGNKTSKFQLNKTACDKLGYTDKITSTINFGKGSTGELFIANTLGQVKDNISNITLEKSFSNSKFLTRLSSHFDDVIEVGREFLLTDSSYVGEFKVMVVNNVSPNSMTTDDFSEFPDNAFEEDEVISEVASMGTFDETGEF